MEQPLVIVVVALAAILVGAAVPALVQLRRTLRTAEMVLETLGPRLDRALDEVTETGAKLRVAAGHVEGGAAEVQKLLAAAGAASDSLRELHGVGTALVPAVATAIQLVVGRLKGRRGQRYERAARDRDAMASDAGSPVAPAGRAGAPGSRQIRPLASGVTPREMPRAT